MTTLTFADRLRAVIGDEPPTPWATARKISGATVHEWLTKGTGPYQKTLGRLVEGTGIPEWWWLHGELPPPAPMDAAARPNEAAPPLKATELKASDVAWSDEQYDAWAVSVPVSDDFVPVRYYRNAMVSAGHGAQNYDERPDALLFARSFLRTIGVKPASAFLVRVRGDSMYPTLHAGWFAGLIT